MNIIVFDTETIGKVSQDIINIGYKIIDLDISSGLYETLKERDYLINRFINNVDYCINDNFVGAKKLAIWQSALKDKKAIKRSLKQVLKTLTNDLNKYQVVAGYAYNSKFDVDKLRKNGFEFNIPIFDIWAYAFYSIVDTSDYIEWAKHNNQLTSTKMYISSTLESVTRYILNSPTFVESHTALDDTQNATAVLIECLKRGVDITKEMNAPKKILSDKVQKKQLQLS